MPTHRYSAEVNESRPSGVDPEGGFFVADYQGKFHGRSHAGKALSADGKIEVTFSTFTPLIIQ